MIVTNGFLTALECTKFVFGRGSAPDPAGELTALLRPPSWFKGFLLLRGMEGVAGKGEEGMEGKGERKEGERPSPLRKFLDPPLSSTDEVVTVGISPEYLAIYVQN